MLRPRHLAAAAHPLRPRPRVRHAGTRRSGCATTRYPRGNRALNRLTVPLIPSAEASGTFVQFRTTTGFPLSSEKSAPKPSVLFRHMANDAGFEPATAGVKVLCSTIELVILEQPKGIETSSSRIPSGRSTTELQPRPDGTRNTTPPHSDACQPGLREPGHVASDRERANASTIRRNNDPC
jgi:hypothetical protein